MKSKPTVKKSKTDKILNCLSRIILIGTTMFLICYWKYIPAQVPMHHDFAGNIDRWGAKGELLILPILAWLIYALISILEHFPGSWNTGVTVTEENKERVYAVLLHMIITMKLSVVLIFSSLIIQSALLWEMPDWWLPAVLVIVFGPMGYYLYRLIKVK